MEMASLSYKLDDHSAHDVIAPIVSAQRQFQQYMQALNVNVSDFVSVKLSGINSYKIWKEQMLHLIKSQDLLHIIEDKHPFPLEKGVDMINELVIGWIIYTMDEELCEESFEYGSAQELWLELRNAYDVFNYRSEGPIFSFEKDSYIEKSLRIKTNGGLYKAAVEGCWWKAKSILKKARATEVITTTGNTILHVAVEKGHNYFVKKLLEFLKDDIEDIETRNKEGETALFIAVVVGNEYAAQLLVQKRKELLLIPNIYGNLPIEFAIFKTNLNVAAYMLRELLKLPSYMLIYEGNNMDVFEIIFLALGSKRYDIAMEFLHSATIYRKRIRSLLRDHQTLLLLVALTFPSDLGFMESFIYPSFDNVRQKTVLKCSLLFHSNFLDTCVEDIERAVEFFNSTCYSWFGKISTILFVPIATLHPIYQLICLLILVLRLTFSMLYLLLWKVLAVTVPPIKNIEKKKKEYEEAKEFIRLLIGSELGRLYNYEPAIRQAIRLDAYQVVDNILVKSPAFVDVCLDTEGHNIIQFAIKNRSEKVYNLLYHIIKRADYYRTMHDSSFNNLAHLVGKLAPSFVLDRTTGAALQLQRELLWREEVEKLFSPIELTKENMDKETPAMVFSREHKKLMKEGENWMKTTAESCSITAALIVTIVFAAAITVPGGSNQDSGVPVFKKEAAFTIFAVSNAFSLFTSTTSLLLFLSILTARFSEKDFLVSLPRRLIFGLLTLFLSTIAMIVSFCAILFLVFCDQRPWMLAPISAFACLPISVIVTIKLPLLVDLIKSTYLPIFGKKSYLESCRINNGRRFSNRILS